VLRQRLRQRIADGEVVWRARVIRDRQHGLVVTVEAGDRQILPVRRQRVEPTQVPRADR